MALYLTEKQTATWQFSPNRSDLENVKIALTKMACFRQAVMDRMTLDSYAMVLEQEDLRAFQVAMAIISETKREPGETAFPDLGSILSLIRRAEESQWRHPQEDPPADRDPVYASRPPRLTGDRLRLAVCKEIEVMQKEFHDKNPTVPMYELFERLPEARRSRYNDLTRWASDFRTYPLKKALRQPNHQLLDNTARHQIASKVTSAKEPQQ